METKIKCTLKKALKILLYIGFPFGILFFYFGVGYINKQCEEYVKNTIKYEIHKGIVIDKYIDKENHSYNTVVYLSVEDSSAKKIIYPNDKSGLIDYIEVGDSIVKNSNSYSFDIYRNSHKKSILLDFACTQ